MTIARILLPLVCSVPVLLGCATPANAPQAEAAMTVQPLLRIRDSAGSARDFYQLGRFYQGQNRFAQAADAYRRALEYHQDNIEARNALATTYSAQGRLNEAIAEFESMLKVAPQLAHLYNNLGYAYYLQDNFAKAIIAFETATALEPDNPRTYNNLGLAYRKLGDPEKSQLAFAHAAGLRNGTNNSGALASASAAVTVVPAAAANIVNIADIANSAPSIALTNNASGIDLPAPVAADTPAPTAVSPAVAMAAPAALALTVIGSSNWSTKGVLAETNGAVSVPVAAAPQSAGSATAGNRNFQLGIANGNGVTGLGRKVRAMLEQQGLPTSHLINLKPYRTQETTIQYRNGFRDEALRLSRILIKAPALVSNDHLRNKADVQLVLGKDATSTMALFRTGASAAQMAKEVEVAAQGDAG